MLGAQALRTKQKLQKAEQKEKEKRHRERQKSIEIQRDKLHRAACEEAAAKFLEIAAQPSLKPKHRHSVHASTVQHLHITTDQLNGLSMDDHHGDKLSTKTVRVHQVSVDDDHVQGGPQRSTSSDYCRAEKKESISHSNPNKFLKWLGLAGKETDKSDFKELKKRRMSTFT